MSDTKKGAFARVSEAKIYGLFDVGIGETMVAIDISKSYAKSIAKEINAAYAERVKGLVKGAEEAISYLEQCCIDDKAHWEPLQKALADFQGK